MAKYGRCDFRELQKFRDYFAAMDNSGIDLFMESLAKELTARLLGKLVSNTQVGRYPKGKVKKLGGTLRRGWTAGQKTSVTDYANGVAMMKVNGNYLIRLENPVYYASYVDKGHRKARTGGWVPGFFIIKRSEAEMKRQLPRIIEKKMKEFLRGRMQ